MGILRKCALFVVLVLPSTVCCSANTANIVLLPDPLYGAHHIGAETAVTRNSRLGVMAAYKRDSDRPTYGESNEHVTNTFSRILIPWVYSKNGAWTNSFFVTGLVGVESDKFKSDAGSKAEVVFVNLGLLAGYQWFWKNGFNISVMGGGALLIESSSEKNILSDENSSVSEYLDKNTKTNKHGAFGIILGWAF